MNIIKMLLSLRLLLCKNGYERAEYIKRKELFGNMGENCFFHPFLMPSDPKQIFIHNNVFITADTTFITHDIVGAMLNRKNNNKDFHYYMAPIEIFDNVAIGAKTIILPGKKIGPNAIIAAGTVVNIDVPEGTVVGGNPAKVIGSLAEFEKSRLKKQWEIEQHE